METALSTEELNVGFAKLEQVLFKWFSTNAHKFKLSLHQKHTCLWHVVNLVVNNVNISCVELLLPFVFFCCNLLACFYDFKPKTDLSDPYQISVERFVISLLTFSKRQGNWNKYRHGMLGTNIHFIHTISFVTNNYCIRKRKF